MDGAARKARLAELLSYIKAQMGYQANGERSHIVEPKRAGSNLFYIVAFSSEIDANAVRMAHWQKFQSVGLFATEDLTPTEQECKAAITREMCRYWQVEKLKFGQFQRSLLRCSFVEDPTWQVFLSYPEVLEAIAAHRIAAQKKKKNAQSARS